VKPIHYATILIFSAVATFSPGQQFAKATAQEAAYVSLYTPKPRGFFMRGEGVFALEVNPATGLVTSVSVVRSTGHKDVDKSATDTLRRWRFRPHTVEKVRVPISFQ
jgi:TonB family protein